ELLRGGDRLFQTVRLPGQAGAHYTDGIGVERGLHVHHVLHDIDGNGQVLAGKHLEPWNHVPRSFAASDPGPPNSSPVMRRRPPCALTWTTRSMVIASSRRIVPNSSPAPSSEALTISANWSQVWDVLPAWQLVMEPGWPEAQLRMK